MSRVYSYIVCHVYIVILYVLFDEVCYVHVFTNKPSVLFLNISEIVYYL